MRAALPRGERAIAHAACGSPRPDGTWFAWRPKRAFAHGREVALDCRGPGGSGQTRVARTFEPNRAGSGHRRRDPLAMGASWWMLGAWWRSSTSGRVPPKQTQAEAQRRRCCGRAFPFSNRTSRPAFGDARAALGRVQRFPASRYTARARPRLPAAIAQARRQGKGPLVLVPRSRSPHCGHVISGTSTSAPFPCAGLGDEAAVDLRSCPSPGDTVEQEAAYPLPSSASSVSNAACWCG